MQLAIPNVWKGARALGRERLLVLVMLTMGHVVVHWYQQLFFLVLPSVRTGLGLSNVQVGALSTARQLTNGLTLPTGYLADSYRGWTGLIVGSAILAFGLGYYFIGIAPSYEWTLVAAALIGLGAALWHPAALGSLSLQFKERRGMALSVHGAGASVGDSVAPVLVGALLLSIDWRVAMQAHLLPAALVAVVLWWSLRNLYQESGSRPAFSSYLTGLREMVTNIQVLGVMGSNTVSQMARLSVLTFFSIYVTETLGYSTFVLGIYLALLYAMGVVSQPIMGVVSDKYGRKAVLVPAFASLAVLFALMAVAQDGVALGLVVAVLGCFFYGTANVTMSAMMDVSPERVHSSAMGITGLFSQPFTLISPIVTGVLVEGYGLPAAFWYAAALQTVATLILVPIPFRSSRE